MRNLEIQIIQYLQQHDQLTEFMQFLSNHSLNYCPILIPLTLIFVSRSSGLRLAAIYAISQYFAILLKLSFQRPRPFWVSEDLMQLGGSAGYAMPSGHTLIATTLIVGFCSNYKAKLILAIGVVGSICVGLSRIHLGVHWPSDVLAGLLLALCIVYGTPAAERRIQRIKKTFNKNRLFLLTLATIVALGFLAYVVVEANRHSPAYNEWITYVEHYDAPRYFGKSLTILLALAVGERFIRLESRGDQPIFIKSVELIYAICGFLLLQEIISQFVHPITATSKAWTELGIQFLVGFWVLYLAQIVTQSAEDFFPKIKPIKTN